MENDKYIIIGAGNNGLELLSHIGEDKVAFFCDNDKKKIGKLIKGIKTISFDEMVDIHQNYKIILTPRDNFYLRLLLEEKNICYTLYLCDAQKHESEKLVLKSSIYKSNDDYIDDLKRRSCELDFLSDYQGFKELVQEAKSRFQGRWIGNEGSESLFYGHFNSIMTYSNIPNCDERLFPKIFHAIFFHGALKPYSSAQIVVGKYSKQEYNFKCPMIPTFDIGPYIRYAKSAIDEKTEEDYINKNGKTLTIFLAHSVEGSLYDIDYNQFIQDINNIWSKKYDLIVVCAYWHDIDREFYEKLNKMGVHIVTAGFRFDEKFIQRLRTIYNLSASIAVYGNDGAGLASLVYGLALNKKCYFLPIIKGKVENTAREEINFIKKWDSRNPWKNYLGILYSKLSLEQETFSDEEMDILDSCFGLSTYLQPEDFQIIYKVCCDIWNNCDYFLDRYTEGVYKTWWYYQKNNKIDELVLLSNAIGEKFWYK